MPKGARGGVWVRMSRLALICISAGTHFGKNALTCSYYTLTYAKHVL